ncbi:MAG: Hsp20/alpha crystallin family protein [Chloroflexi bacterium]|nr:Hsp20/alpha crystallin family protein [Chloroflexota bacterium]
MTVSRFYPRRDVMSLRDAMDRLFEESLARPAREWDDRTSARESRLPLDVYTTSEEIVILASLPGLTPDEVDISIEGDALTISGELRGPLENVDYVFQERSFGRFSRTLTLNVPVDVERVEASFENGVLTVVLPKSERDRPRVIKVEGR